MIFVRYYFVKSRINRILNMGHLAAGKLQKYVAEKSQRLLYECIPADIEHVVPLRDLLFSCDISPPNVDLNLEFLHFKL